MTPDELLVIKRIARYRSLSLAASKMGVSSSTLSRKLKACEKSLGVELFERNGRHLQINRFGMTVLHHADLMEQVVNEAAEDIWRTHQTDERLLRIYFRQSLGDNGTVLAPFIRSHPDILLDIVLADKEVEERGFDLEFASLKEPLSGSNVVHLCDEGYVLAVSHEHPLSERSSVSLADLKEETFVVPPSHDGGRLLEGLCRGFGYQPVNRIDCPQAWGAVHYAEQGMGVLLAPEFTMLAGTGSKVVKIPISDNLGKRHLYITHAGNAPYSDAALQLVDYLKSYFQKLSRSKQ